MGDGSGMAEGGSVLDFMSMKSYPDMSLEISMLNSLGKCWSIATNTLSLDSTEWTSFLFTDFYKGII